MGLEHRPSGGKGMGGGEETPSEPESSRGDDEEEDEDREEGEVTPRPHSSPPEDLPSLGDIFSQQVGISVGVRQLKWQQMETGSSTGLLPQPHLARVSLDLQGVSVVPVVTWMSHLLWVLQVPPFSPAGRVATTMMVGPSSSGARDVKPSAMKARPWSFLPVSSRYDIVRQLTPLPFFLFLL
jgi:hypothetical protein